ncbi:tRNA(adenine34) deaminase [Catalinimonas alkaloidigena]|uniref:tRNA-specific adenosine deaminase n=1 Tax=Catalinimonas alkaloidigena TaxID=1075417 RepID=A0A1G9F9D6_9BACT|nr:nucleoside deaminase [Catalinimonas alkaloidigena]SDK84823.1 tRNA(adenine34) deaminase [Catalinimonas alkaloidigena]
MQVDPFSPDYFMGEALKLARQAAGAGEVPVGAVVVCRNRIIARAWNQTEQLNDVTAHAEMLAITAAANHLGGKYLSQCELYVTLEPCVMCAGALAWAQLGKLYYAAADEKRGFSRLASAKGTLLHPKTQIMSGLRAEEARQLLQEFFGRLRNPPSGGTYV